MTVFDDDIAVPEPDGPWIAMVMVTWRDMSVDGTEQTGRRRQFSAYAASMVHDLPDGHGASTRGQLTGGPGCV